MKTEKQLNARTSAIVKSANGLAAAIHTHIGDIVEFAIIPNGNVAPLTFLVNSLGNSAVRRQAIIDYAMEFCGAKWRNEHKNQKTGLVVPAKFTRNDVKVTDLDIEKVRALSPFEFAKDKIETINAINLQALINGLVKRVEEGADKVPTKKGATHNIPADKLAALKALVA
jgi:hypothetical protein